MRFKKILFTLAIAASFWFAPSISDATCSNFATYVDGQVLTASSLNSFQTNYTDCVNAVLDGDTYTGNNVMHSASDILFYSDTGSNLEAAIYGDDGDILGAIRQDGAYGVDIDLSAGVFTVQCEDATCSATNPAHIRMQSTTSGDKAVLRVTAAATFQDRNGTSDLTAISFGLTETVDWNQDIPFFLYVVNRADSDLDGSDGSSVFAISRSPVMQTSPASANNIHDTGDTASSESENDIFILDDVTVANYTSLPVQLIGAFRMQWDTDTADDWAIQTLSDADGIGPDAIRRTLATQWTFPVGQNGGIESTHLFVSGGDASADIPKWATPGNIIALYHIAADGQITYEYSTMSAGNCTNGDVAAQLRLAVPVSSLGYSSRYLAPFGYAAITGVADAIVLIEIPTSAVRVFDFKSTSGGQVRANEFSDTGDDIGGQVQYYGFDPTP
jgi:hypothetical protein|tara:strand:- start:13159 stop:14490 length:1332 start_codon:yes stop_codon:yes gene_type:complete